MSIDPGTLGRQGNNALFESLRVKAESKGKRIFLFLMAELNPVKLALFDFIEVLYDQFWFQLMFLIT